MKSCGASGRPSLSGTRHKEEEFSSGDQRGVESRGRWSADAFALAGDTLQMEVRSHPSLGLLSPHK